MHERHSIRYDAELLPEDLKNVTVSWGENASFETAVRNCCALGIRVSLPPLTPHAGLPKKKDTVRVHMPIGRTWLTGMCVYAANEPDGSVSMGIYFYNPSEQNHLNSVLSRSLSYQAQLDRFISHEWEELVARLCISEDPDLKEFGKREREILLAHREGKSASAEARTVE
jgi:hypothetical protein